jgi:hypothetical protein
VTEVLPGVYLRRFSLLRFHARIVAAQVVVEEPPENLRAVVLSCFTPKARSPAVSRAEVPVTEPTVMDMVLSELKLIRQSIHDLRDEMQGKWGLLSGMVERHEQWIESHERWAADQVAFTKENRAKLEVHDGALNEMLGALRAVRWIGAAVGGAIGIVEFILHR